MRFGRQFWSRLAVGVSVVVAAPGWAQQQEEAQDVEPSSIPQPLEEAKPAQVQTPSPALLSGPSLRETGRIGAMPSAAPVNLIEPESQLTSRNEKSIGPAATALGEEEAELRKPRAGVIDKRMLEREIAERFAAIDDCRVDVARSHRVLPTSITAGTLLLRWTIERDGTTSATDVVATSPIDMSVMDCAKQVMSRWTFTRPRGGSVTVERAFTFKPLRGS